MASPAPPRRRPVTFRPRFTLMILYFVAFFMGFSLLMVLPDLLEAARALPPGPAELDPADLERAREIAREGYRGKFPVAFVLATTTVGALVWFHRLPGFREQR